LHFTKIQYYIDLIMVFTQKELKVRYKSSFLGYLWSIANPLALATVFFFAFKIVMKIPMEDYALFLITGLFPFQWFSNSVGMSPMVFFGNSSLVKKVNFPRHLLLISMVLQDMIHFILSIPVIILFIFIYHKPPFFSWIYGIPILLFVQFLIIYGITLAISSINLFFRDLERITGILITLLFYLTPVFYPETMIPYKYRPLINLNPLAPLIISWRNLFLHGTVNVSSFSISLLYAIFIFIAGYAIYRKLSWKFAEVL